MHATSGIAVKREHYCPGAALVIYISTGYHNQYINRSEYVVNFDASP